MENLEYEAVLFFVYFDSCSIGGAIMGRRQILLALVSHPNSGKADMVAVFFKTPSDLASKIGAEDLSPHVVAATSHVCRVVAIDKSLFDRAKKAPGMLPGVTHLLALHNLEAWIAPPGNAPDLIRERFEAAWPAIIQPADK